MGHRIRLREHLDSPLWGSFSLKAKAAVFKCARSSRVKLCAVRMCNAMLRNNLAFEWEHTTGVIRFSINSHEDQVSSTPLGLSMNLFYCS